MTRRWSAAQVKDGIADDDVHRLDDLAPTQREPPGARVVSQLARAGLAAAGREDGFAAGQPQYNFHPARTRRHREPRTTSSRA